MDLSLWHHDAVSDSDRPPWTATARALVLYNPEDEWRYAIYSEAWVLDGVLLGVSVKIPPEEAQALLVAKVEGLTDRQYAATWTQDEPHWWTAELTTLR
jgi:hypothetical protein